MPGSPLGPTSGPPDGRPPASRGGSPEGSPAGSPAAGARPRRRTGLLLTMILAVLTAVLLLVFVLRLARQPGGKVNLGDPEFTLGKGSVFAPKIAARGPLIFPPLRPGSVTLYVQHLGGDPRKGWLAFGAHPTTGEAANCFVQWRPPSTDFVDPCTQRVYPADGQGLDQYAVRVDPAGNVIINLRQSTGTTPATAAPS